MGVPSFIRACVAQSRTSARSVHLRWVFGLLSPQEEWYVFRSLVIIWWEAVAVYSEYRCEGVLCDTRVVDVVGVCCGVG